MRDLLLASFWALSIPLSFVAPQAGVMFWLWDAVMSPTELMYGFMSSVPTNKLIAGTTLIGLLFGRVKDAYLDRVLVTLICLIVCSTVSYTLALDEYPDDLDLYLKVVKEIIFTFAFCWLVVGRRWIECAVFSIAIAVSFLGVKEGLISLLTIGGHKIVGSRALGDNNQLAAALVVTLPLLYFLSQYAEKRIVRLGLLAVMLCNIVTVVMTFSRGGFVGLVVVGLFLIKDSRYKVRTATFAVCVAAGVFLFAPEAWFNRVDTIQTAEGDGSFMGRVNAWKVSWLIAKDNPFFGGGPHAVQHWSVWGRYAANLHELDWIPTPYPEFFPRAAHSIYFEVLGDLGFSGFLLYFLLFYFAVRYCGRIQVLTRGYPDMGWAADLAGYLRISLFAYLVTGALLSIAYQELLFILLAVTTRLYRSVVILRRKTESEAPSYSPTRSMRRTFPKRSVHTVESS